jgi:hypothetical protein
MPDTIYEPAREIPVFDQADVVVLGAGPAGVAAAVGAARGGAEVLLVERYNSLGGLATGGLVTILLSFGPRGQCLMSGLAVETWERLKASGMVRTPDESDLENPHYDAEMLKAVYLELCTESGVRLLLHTWAVGTVVRNGRVEAVVTESKAGRRAIRGGVFIDASGDGDAAAWSGVPFETSSRPLGIGLDWRWANVDYPRFKRFCRERPDRLAALRPAMAEANVAWPPKPDWCDDRAWFITNARGNALDPHDLTRIELDMRALALRTFHFYRAFMPGFESATLLDTASQIGVRESRRIVGECTLDGDDVPGGSFADSVGTGVTWCGPRAGEPFDLPFRALVPRAVSSPVDNLLFAGRCISATHDAHQQTRVINNCLVSGQGAGAAAAVALRSGRPPLEVAVPELQAALRAQGVEVG